MAGTGVDAVRVFGHQYTGHTDFIGIAQQLVRIIDLDGQADQCRHRGQGDVALVPGDFQAQHFLAVPFALADDAFVRNGAGVGAGHRGGEGETGNLVAAGQSGKIMLFLLIRAVVHQQLARAEGVGHHHGNGSRYAPGGNLHHDFRVGGVGEPQAAVFFGNHQAEKAVLTDELPDLVRQVVLLVGDFPVVEHGAQLFHRAVQEGLFLAGEVRRLGVQQLVPFGLAGEKFAVPVHRAGFQGFRLGIREFRQPAAHPAKQGAAELVEAQVAGNNKD